MIGVPDDDDAEGSWIAFVDTIFNAMFIFAVLYVLQSFLPHLKAQETAKKDGINAGKMCVELFWPDNLNIDIDLFGRGPDQQVVGYRNRSAPLMDLLRDDLGFVNNASGRNFETICSRQLAEGEWTFNAHYYAPHETPEPHDVPILLTVSFPVGDANVTGQPPLTAKGVLLRVGEEITLIDFEIDKQGKVIGGSINSVFQSIRQRGAQP